MSRIKDVEDTCPECDIHLVITEWEIDHDDDKIRCPNCDYSQDYKSFDPKDDEP